MARVLLVCNVQRMHTNRPENYLLSSEAPSVSRPRVFVFVGTSRNVNTRAMSRRGKLTRTPDPRSDPGSKDPA